MRQQRFLPRRLNRLILHEYMYIQTVILVSGRFKQQIAAKELRLQEQKNGTRVRAGLS